MKTKLLLAGLITFMTAGITTAQPQDEPAVKILPAAEVGTLKVVYGYDSRSTVEVRFIGESGLLKTDRIKAGTFNKGFLKKYDVRRIKDNSFWVEISSAELKVRYKMVSSADGKSFIPHLEQTTYNHPLVAAIN